MLLRTELVIITKYFESYCKQSYFIWTTPRRLFFSGSIISYKTRHLVFCFNSIFKRWRNLRWRLETFCRSRVNFCSALNSLIETLVVWLDLLGSFGGKMYQRVTEEFQDVKNEKLYFAAQECISVEPATDGLLFSAFWKLQSWRHSKPRYCATELVGFKVLGVSLENYFWVAANTT